MHKIILSIAVFVLATIAMAAVAGAEDKADGPNVGDKRVALAFCMDRGSAELLAEQLEQNGKHGYAAVMADSDIPCLDSRIHDGRPIPITLKERGWTTETLEGIVLEFWLATDPEDFPGWVWMEVPGRRS
jgi:hypothetical protein